MFVPIDIVRWHSDAKSESFTVDRDVEPGALLQLALGDGVFDVFVPEEGGHRLSVNIDERNRQPRVRSTWAPRIMRPG